MLVRNISGSVSPLFFIINLTPDIGIGICGRVSDTAINIQRAQKKSEWVCGASYLVPFYASLSLALLSLRVLLTSSVLRPFGLFSNTPPFVSLLTEVGIKDGGVAWRVAWGYLCFAVQLDTSASLKQTQIEAMCGAVMTTVCLLYRDCNSVDFQSECRVCLGCLAT